MINRVQGSENSRERTPWPNRRYDARQSIDNIVHLPSGKHGMSAKGSENKTVAQGDDKVACPSAVLMFRGVNLLTLFHGLIRFVLEYGDGVHQNHAGPKVLADAVIPLSPVKLPAPACDTARNAPARKRSARSPCG